MEKSGDEEANDEDVAWMRLIASGDEAAFRSLVEKHQHAVVGTIGKMTNFSADSEDLAQEVFLRIWKYSGKYQPTAKFTTYLFTITRNLVFNYTKRKSLHKENSLEEQQDDWHQQLADRGPKSQPDQSLEQSELRALVDGAIAKLPEKQRLAVVLRRYEKMPYEEIASVLELSVPAVKSQLFRARTALRELLAPYLED
ncbi:sigma-70 family RNA polymerase sigma factor [Akkermansiaceae bacterium]|nr:sigma-70 family RNA polymerase sigma factor [Akkermansiaceae bacterium]MDB4525381.1 sigma-70 family RNA polymerase sigma factor [Akkermansiaceae bacterium]